MDGDADTNEGGQAGTEGLDRPIDPVLLNAVAEVLVDGATPVLGDESSRDLITTAVEEATTEAERRQFVAAIESVEDGDGPGGTAASSVGAVIDPVRTTLADRNVRAIVDHEARFSLNPREVAVYNFTRTKDPAALDVEGMNLPSSIAPAVRRGANAVADGAYESAAEAFVEAVETAGTGEGSVLARTLAAWAHHWAGDDDGAIDFVEEALHLHMDAWAPTLAGYSADPDRSFAWPRQFRDGKYAAMAVLRYTVDTPAETDLTPSLGLGQSDDNGGVEEWMPLEGTDECTPVHRLATENTLRLRLEGRVPAFPAMHSYYLGLGIIDLEVTELREIYRFFVDGPVGERVTETIRFETEN